MFLSSKVFVIAVATVAHQSFSVAKQTVHSKIQRKLEGEQLSCPYACNWEDTMVPLIGTTITGTVLGYGDFTIENLGGDGSVVKNSFNYETHEFYISSEEDDQMFIVYDPIDGSLCERDGTEALNQAGFIITPTDDESLDGTDEINALDSCNWFITHYCYCFPTSAPTDSTMPSVPYTMSPSIAHSSSPTEMISEPTPSVADGGGAPLPTDSTDEDDGNVSECCCDCDCAKGKTYLFDTIRSVFGGFD